MRVGYVGLGNMGRAQAERLIERGHDLVVWDRTIEKAASLPADAVDSPAEAVSSAAVTFVCVSDSAAVADVMHIEGGLLSGDLDGKIIVDCTTNHFAVAPLFAREFADAGAAYVEAPVMGSVPRAREGGLTVLAHATASARECVTPLLEDIAATVLWFDEPSMPTKLNLVNSALLAAFTAAIAEATAFGESVGLDRGRVLEVLGAGPARGVVFDAERPKLAEEDFSAHFSASLLYKDLCYAQDLARELRKPLFSGSAAKELYAMMFADGSADSDISALYLTLTEH